MKCYYHNYSDAVAVCSKCGVALCNKCIDTTYDNIIICVNKCNIKDDNDDIDYENPEERKKIKKKLIIAAIICSSCFLFGIIDSYLHMTDYSIIFIALPVLFILILFQAFLPTLVKKWITKSEVKKLKSKKGDKNEVYKS